MNAREGDGLEETDGTDRWEYNIFPAGWDYWELYFLDIEWRDFGTKSNSIASN